MQKSAWNFLSRSNQKRPPHAEIARNLVDYQRIEQERSPEFLL